MQLNVSRPLVPSHARVDDPAEHAHYWARLLRHWDVRGKRAASATFFPGANPCSVARADLPRLHAAEHVVALKSDGVRYALFLTTRPGSNGTAPVALMVDRARNMYEVEVLAPADHFCQGTVLEGELVWRQPQERQLLFLVFDAVAIAGTSLLRESFAARLEAATRVTRWSEELAAMPDAEARVAETGCLALVHFDPPVVLRPKRFVAAAHAAKVWAERAAAEHRVDGLVIHRADAGYVHGTATGAVYKWKPAHTVDLAGPPDALRVAEGGPLGPRLAGRDVRVLESRVVVGRDDDLAEYLVEVTPEAVTLFAMRTRPDKCTANGRWVVEATVRDAIEAIAPEEL